MDIDLLEKKLNRIKGDLDNDINKKIIENINKNDLLNNLDEDEINGIRTEYLSTLPDHERIYQLRNNEYKDLISRFSDSYLEMSDFYVGSDLIRETYLDSKKDTVELFFIFVVAALWEPYINAYHEKYLT